MFLLFNKEPKEANKEVYSIRGLNILKDVHPPKCPHKIRGTIILCVMRTYTPMMIQKISLIVTGDVDEDSRWFVKHHHILSCYTHIEFKNFTTKISTK